MFLDITCKFFCCAKLTRCTSPSNSDMGQKQVVDICSDKYPSKIIFRSPCPKVCMTRRFADNPEQLPKAPRGGGIMGPVYVSNKVPRLKELPSLASRYTMPLGHLNDTPSRGVPIYTWIRQLGSTSLYNTVLPIQFRSRSIFSSMPLAWWSR